jgi:hypothetical protein
MTPTSTLTERHRLCNYTISISSGLGPLPRQSAEKNTVEYSRWETLSINVK